MKLEPQGWVPNTKFSFENQFWHDFANIGLRSHIRVTDFRWKCSIPPKKYQITNKYVIIWVVNELLIMKNGDKMTQCDYTSSLR